MKIICNFQRIFVPSVQHVFTLTERLSRSSARVKCSLWSKSSVVRQVGTSPQLWLCKPIYDFFFLFSKEKFVKLTKLDIREFWSSFKAAVLFAFKVNLRSSKKPPKIMTKWKIKIVSKQHRHKKKNWKQQQKKKSWCLEEKYCLVQGTSFIQIFILWPKMTMKMCGIQKKNFIE